MSVNRVLTKDLLNIIEDRKQISLDLDDFLAPSIFFKNLACKTQESGYSDLKFAINSLFLSYRKLCLEKRKFRFLIETLRTRKASRTKF